MKYYALSGLNITEAKGEQIFFETFFLFFFFIGMNNNDEVRRVQA